MIVVNQHHGTQVLEVVTYASLIEKRLLKILETYPNAETISSHHLLNPLYAFGPNFYQRNLAIGEELIFLLWMAGKLDLTADKDVPSRYVD